MAVLQMRRVSICALKKDRKEILEKLQAMGVMEMSQILEEETDFQKMDTQGARNTFEKKAVLADFALDILQEYVPEKKSLLSSLEGKKLIDKEDYDQIAAQKEEIQNTKITLRSQQVKMKNGKKAVRITWYNRNGEMMEFDGVEIFRSTKRNSGYGKKPIFTSETDKYYNTAVKAGTKYYYKLRGYVVIDGQKYYTDYSLKAIRTVK